MEQEITMEQETQSDSGFQEGFPKGVSSKTVQDLGLIKSQVKHPIISIAQVIEPMRDGQSWCSREDAESLLVNTALNMMVGPLGIHPTVYKLEQIVDGHGCDVLVLSLE